MTRRLKYPPRPAPPRHPVAFEEFVAPPSAERPKTLPKAALERLLNDTNQLKDAGGWADMTPKHFVGLYVLLHRKVYGVDPEEVREAYTPAVRAATRVLNQEFKGSRANMVSFMRWVWNREQKRLPHRDAENTFRIGWRLQFGRQLLSDYRVYIVRRNKR